MIEKLKKTIQEYLPDADLVLLEKAFNFASHAHFCQIRATGEPYINHCYAVAMILTELRLDVNTICASLLHDILEDTLVVREELKEEFGEEITVLVEGVTKINKYKFDNQQTAQAENCVKCCWLLLKTQE